VTGTDGYGRPVTHDDVRDPSLSPSVPGGVGSSPDGPADAAPDVAGAPDTDGAAVREAVQDAARYAEQWLEVQHRLHDLPGLQVAIAVGDDVVLSRAYGVADVTTGETLTTDHLFRVASHSKSFTATVVMQLVESGALRLDDRTDAWLDHLSGTPLGAATVRDLLGHGAGVSRDSDDGDFWQLAGPFPDGDTLRQITAHGADVLPVAEQFKYSNLGYGLLGLVVEAASGKPYAEMLAAAVAGPLGLRRTGAEWDEAAGTFATGHTGRGTARPGELRRPIAPVHTGALAPATGVCSTAEDMVRFAAGHYLGDTRLLSDASKRRMQRAEWAGVRPDEDYGLGLIVTTIDGRRTVGHSGGFPGYITRTLWDPTDRFAVSVLTNAIDGPASSLASAVVRLIDLAAKVPLAPGTGDVAADLDRFTGRFANLWGLMDVVRLGGRLYAVDPTGADPTASPVHLTPEDGSTLRIGGGTGYGSPGETFRYTWAADGSVRSLRAGSSQTMYPAEPYLDALAAQHDVSGAVRVA
jgi:CubicO group peptidase (beta-lactamase class C family)